MAQLPPMLSARWQNSAMKAAHEELWPIMKQLFDLSLVDGYLGGTEPLTLADLKKMDPNDAGEALARLIHDPMTTSQGVELLDKYAAWMASNGGAA